MNWILLYILCIVSVLAILTIGFVLNNHAQICINNYGTKENSKGITAKEFTNLMFQQNKLKNIDISSLKSKKTNYYSAKYNVIKLSPEIIYSANFYNIAICAKCTNHATKQQYTYISATLCTIFSVIAKIISLLFVPIVFICAILNISFRFEKFAYVTTIIALVCYVIMFLVQLIIYFLNQLSTKQTKIEIEKLGIFEDSDIKNIHLLHKALNKTEFFSFTRLSLSFLSLLNPATLLDKKIS